MTHGRPANVRSHRRGGASRRRLAVAPWIIFSLVGVLVVSGLSVGYAFIMRRTCSGQVKATVIASPGLQSVLAGLSRRWQEGEPSVDGTCVSVEIEAKDSAVVAQTLGASSEWDVKTGGSPPDAWVPESSAWVLRAASAPIAERMVPDRRPSLARSPTVIAMPKPMAEAFGWPKAQLSWQDMIGKFANPDGWKAYGKDWGAFRFGMTDPLKSTSGVLTLMAVLDGDDDGEVTAAEQATLFKLKQVRAVYTDTTDEIFADLARLDQEGEDKTLRHISAFPALEQDVLAYNRNNPKTPLVALYPSNGSGEADHPYLILDSPWADRKRQAAAKAFLDFARGPKGRAVFLENGLRDANRAPGKELTEINGFTAKLTTLPRAVLLADSVKQSLDTWTALTRPTNVLVVLDVSGSMDEQVPGAGKNRMALAREAARNSVTLFADDTQAGLWVFSTKLDGNRDYKALVPLGKLTEQVNGKSRKEAMLSAIDGLRPNGATGLYDTAAAAQQAVLDNYKADSTNLVVLMTDGKNEDEGGGLDFNQLKEKLTQNSADRNKRVPVVTVGYGDDADFATLQEISRLTGATSYTSKTAFDINQVLLTAIFGRV